MGSQPSTTDLIIMIRDLFLIFFLSVRDLQENSVSGRSVHLLLRRIQNLLRVWEVYREIRPVWRSVQGVRPVPDEPGLHWTASEMLLQQMPNKAKVQKSPK